MAVDDLVAVVADHGQDPFSRAEQTGVGNDRGGDAQLAGLVGERPFGKTDEVDGFGFVQPGQKGEHVGLCAAYVTAGDHVDDFHKSDLGEYPLEFLLHIYYNYDKNCRLSRYATDPAAIIIILFPLRSNENYRRIL